MTNIFESVSNALKTVTDDEEKGPLHVGEVMNLWTYLTMLEEANRFAEVGLNTTTDDDLIEALKHSWDDCHKQVVEIQKVLREEGVSLPPTAEPKPKTSSEAIPSGVKLTDDEIANGVVIKLVSAISFCGVGLSQAIRADIGSMWYNFLNVRVKFSAYYMPIMRKRGWIKVPPYYVPNGLMK
ncbi:DUF3231 family protein [Bacillus sp. HMF5848]|uniref:DUF3231 family protein n=1 Tax=Bacillus sp. HMF5848 TaxID=2495421 RepID=UPI000F76DB77|nr:DUF3231 family protein [Bacillus sp. HMF5848]RSK26013.1 DUF3231 family protein [Bacillus sp. HMF5848]